MKDANVGGWVGVRRRVRVNLGLQRVSHSATSSRSVCLERTDKLAYAPALGRAWSQPQRFRLMPCWIGVGSYTV